ncbi:hypothetical protein BDM02DRAFT_3122096 [Thelephora ganbajun]|uniref:Uncharacterized protein n=1 Tax=Thelephora ganbajun TaxID=370292 RepID=A0ACB6Z3I4_THEGA|nr:hypothetical protein BDM02DRAFT_3122096 [Thelephora ganbajun]
MGLGGNKLFHGTGKLFTVALSNSPKHSLLDNVLETSESLPTRKRLKRCSIPTVLLVRVRLSLGGSLFFPTTRLFNIRPALYSGAR